MSVMNVVKKVTSLAVLGTVLAVGTSTAHAADMSRGANNFYKSEKVKSEVVRFKNTYGMTTSQARHRFDDARATPQAA